MKAIALAAGALLLWIATPSQQSVAQRPVRDAGKVEPTGTGVIGGIVETDDAERKPLRTRFCPSSGRRTHDLPPDVHRR